MISKSYTKIVWNLNSNKVTPTPLGVTSDTGRGIEVRIKVDEIFQTPENTLRLAAEKEDGTAIYLTADIVSGRYLFTKLAQLFSYSGKVTARLELQQGTDFISSENFVFEVPPSVAMSMIQSSSDFTALQKALTKTEAAFTGLRFISDSEKLRVGAEQLRTHAETGRVSAETGRVSAETGRVTAEQGRAALLAEIEEARATEAALVDRLEALDVSLLESLEQRMDDLVSSLRNEVHDPLFEGNRWYPIRGQIDSDLGVLTATGDGTMPYFGINKQVNNTSIENKINQYNKIYYSAKVLSESEQITNIRANFLNYGGSSAERITNMADPIPDVYHRISDTFSASQQLEGYSLMIQAYATDTLNKSIKFRSPIVLNLTKIFGVGKEPSKDEMDGLIELIGWFEDSASLNKITISTLKKAYESFVENERLSNRIDELATIVSEGGNLKRHGLEHAPLPELMDVSDLGWTVDGNQVIEPYWVENHNDSVRIIGYWNSQLFQSLDNGVTWVRILSGGLISGRPDFVFCTQNPNFNKSVFAVKSGKIYQSSNLANNSIGSWNIVLDGITAGDLTMRYGRSIRGNVTILSTYHTGYDPTGENPAKYLYISQDYGDTFREVALPEYFVKDPTQFHIHDVEYDPFDNRIWISIGDQTNSGLYYSNDLGVTWEKVVDAPIRPTNITAIRDFVLFGTDDKPSAIYGYEKDKVGTVKEVIWGDFKVLATPRTASDDTLLIANNMLSNTDKMIAEYPHHLYMPFEASQSGSYSPTFYCSADGVRWEGFFRLDQLNTEYKTAILDRTMGYASNDPDKTLYIFFYHSSVGNKMVRIKMPEWVEIPIV